MSGSGDAAPRTLLRRLRADVRGATIIEFAAVGAPFLALILAILQISILFFAQQALDTVAERTGRQIVTGSAQSSGMTRTAFMTAACGNLPAFLKCPNLMIDVRTASDFASVSTATPTLTYDASGNVNNSWQFNTGGAGSVVVMRLMYQFPVIGAPLGFNLSNMGRGKRLLVSTSVFRTEPYGSAS